MHAGRGAIAVGHEDEGALVWLGQLDLGPALVEVECLLSPIDGDLDPLRRARIQPRNQGLEDFGATPADPARCAPAKQ